LISRASRRPGRTGALALALTIGAFGALAPAAHASWGKPFALAPPGSLDVIPTQLAFSSQGGSAAAFGIEDVDTPGSAQAYLVSRSASGSVGSPRQIGAAGQILALSFDGSALELLTATSPRGLDCCSAVQAVRLTGRGTLQPPRTLMGGLTGATDGELLTLADGGMLAAAATERGVWVAQSPRGDRFGPQHRLSAAGETPESLTAAWLGGQNTLVAWTSAPAMAGSRDARSIYYAIGTRRSGPRRVQTLVTVPAGHRIDELGVARRGPGATAAWIESWYDRGGNFHSQVEVADVGAHPAIRALSPPGQPASGLSIAADAAGDQGVAWKTCRQNGSCSVRANPRGKAGRFGASTGFGALDASQTPALTVGSGGQVVIGWVRSGHPVAAAGSAVSGRFGASTVLSSTAYAFDLTVGFGPGRDALAAWTQGTLHPSVVGAAYRAR